MTTVFILINDLLHVHPVGQNEILVKLNSKVLFSGLCLFTLKRSYSSLRWENENKVTFKLLFNSELYFGLQHVHADRVLSFAFIFSSFFFVG